MQISKLVKFKKNPKFIRLNRLYLELLKTKHLLTFFIGSIKRRQLLKLYNVISSKHLFLNFLTKLEYRIEFILIKAGLVITGKQVRQLVAHRHVRVNNKVIKSCAVHLKIYDLISLSTLYASQYKRNLICNLFKTAYFFTFLKKKKKINKKFTVQKIFAYFKFPSFLEVSFRTFAVFIIKKPLLSEFFYPKTISLYDCNQLRFIL